MLSAYYHGMRNDYSIMCGNDLVCSFSSSDDEAAYGEMCIKFARDNQAKGADWQLVTYDLKERVDLSHNAALTNVAPTIAAFCVTMGNMQASRAMRTLIKTCSVEKTFAPRAAHIVRLFNEGYRVTHNPRGRRLCKDSYFFLESDLTKTGIDFALWYEGNVLTTRAIVQP
jgi:hypothetical protein